MIAGMIECMAIRSATSAGSDLDAIIHHRRATYREVGFTDEHALDLVGADYRIWVGPKLESGEYLGWFALAPDCSIAAGLGLWLMDNPPSLFVPGRWRGNIVNVYTEPPHRRKGLASALMRTAIAWCSAHEVPTIVLHSTPDGRALYESLGFAPTTEMRLTLSPTDIEP
jgi:GNAT superfamily N-acetyltransferase